MQNSEVKRHHRHFYYDSNVSELIDQINSAYLQYILL